MGKKIFLRRWGERENKRDGFGRLRSIGVRKLHIKLSDKV